MAEKASKRARTEPGEPASADEESCTVLSAEGAALRWPRRVALRAGTLKDWINDTGGEGEFRTQLTATALEKLRAACAHEGGEATSPIVSLQLDETTDLLHAANFLEATAVLTAAARHLCGTLLAGKSVEELRSALGAANDLSACEQATAPHEPLFTTPAGLGAAEVEEEGGHGASVAGTSSSAPPAMRRSLLTRAGSEDAIVSALHEANPTLLCRLKGVSRAWRTRARNELCARVSCRSAGQAAPTSLDEIVELDLKLLSEAGRAHEVAAAGRHLLSLARLRGWGFVVDVQAVRQADLRQVKYDVAPLFHLGAPPPADAALATSPALRGCVAGEGEPLLELLLAAVACAASGEALRVPVQHLRETDPVELDLSRLKIDVGGARLLALLLPTCNKLARLE